MANSASSNELHSITKHNNIVISGVGANEVLKFDGSNWINQTLAESGIAPVASPTFTTGATSPAWITGNSGTVKFMDANGSNYFTLAANATTTADIAYTWPAAGPGSNGLMLSSTTAGVLSWAAAGGGGASVIQMDDNVNIALGSGSDSTLYYDGTDTIWRPKAVGSGQMRWQDTSGTMAYFETYGSQGPDVYLYHSKGSIGAHTVVASGERHGRIRFGASDGTAFHVGADIIGVANQNWLPAGDNDRGTRLEFYTTADDSATPILAMTLAASSEVTVKENDSTVSVTKGIAKAYGRMNDGTLQTGSVGVSSCSKSSTGQYLINWNPDFENTNYMSVGTPNSATKKVGMTDFLAINVEVKTYDNDNSYSNTNVAFVAFGEVT